jgi:hypothetical protein
MLLEDSKEFFLFHFLACVSGSLSQLLSNNGKQVAYVQESHELFMKDFPIGE